ncbi:hypothetical protein B0O99DRAFT_634686 [Bisporella sp. PMI_857]|nr:hypothetical protein B0O99DRAFT_634686 [Bisporella sp. PMI_857]
MILGRNFFDYFRILIDVHYRQLRWLSEFPPAYTYSRTIATYTRDDQNPDSKLAQALPKKDCLHVQAVQAQLNVQQNSKQPTLGKSSFATASQELTRASAHGPTWARETSKSLKIMANELSRLTTTRLGKSSKLNKLSKHLDIKMISGNGFMLNARQQGIELFSISLDGLERIIEDRKQEQQPVEPEALESIVLSTYHSRLAFFSKQEVLPFEQALNRGT